MLGRLAGRPPNAGTPAAVDHELRQLMVTKASNRAAVHGTKLPTGDAVDTTWFALDHVQPSHLRRGRPLTAAVPCQPSPEHNHPIKDEVEKEMEKKKEEKEKKRVEIEKAVDSKISSYAAPPAPVK
ncbi:hypothetical protein CRG98_035203 [Punica granatum]|uniref:Uncharacterized protein n=1 Tax=Punica granatum TaxID=22663 RepID=A0A2I0IL37_PUNGR|nr:hypothetical protein CRG98_035203 [Punica granatum]